MVDITNYGLGSLDVSGLGDIYERGALPMHGFSEAQKQAELRKRIRRMQRAQMVMNMSGLRVPDYTSNLQSLMAGIKPEKTRSEAEFDKQVKILGQEILRLKPRDDTQAEQIASAMKLGAEHVSAFQAMTGIYDWGEMQELYSMDEAGKAQIFTGQKRDPRMLAAREGGAGSKTALDIQQKQLADEWTRKALTEMQTADPKSAEAFKKIIADKGKTNPEIWYNSEVRKALYSAFSNIYKEGELAPLWKTVDGRTDMTMKPKNGAEWNRLIKDEGYATEEKHLAVGMQPVYDRIRATAREAAQANAGVDEDGLPNTPTITDYMDALDGAIASNNVYIADRALFRKEYRDSIISTQKAELDIRNSALTLDEKLRKALDYEDYQEYGPLVKRMLLAGPPIMGSGNAMDPELYVRSRVTGLNVSEETKDKLIKYGVDFLKDRQDAEKAGVDLTAAKLGIEATEQSMKATTQRMRKVEKEIEALVDASTDRGNANQINSIVVDAIDMFKLGMLPTAPGKPSPTLGQYVKQKIAAAKIVLNEATWNGIHTKLVNAEKNFRDARKKELEIDILQLEKESGKAYPDAGFRFNSRNQIYADAQGKPIFVDNPQKDADARAAKFYQKEARGYEDIDSDWTIYQGGVLNKHGKEAFPELVGTSVVSHVGRPSVVINLQQKLNATPERKELREVEKRYQLAKFTLEQGEITGGSHDYFAIVNVMRSIDPSIVTMGEIEVIGAHTATLEGFIRELESIEQGTSLSSPQRATLALIMENYLKNTFLLSAGDLRGIAESYIRAYGDQPFAKLTVDDIAPWLGRWEGEVFKDKPLGEPGGGFQIINIPEAKAELMKRADLSKAGAAEVVPDYAIIEIPTGLESIELTPTDITVTDPSGEQVETIQPKVEAEVHTPVMRGELPKLPFYDDIKRWDAKGLGALSILESGLQGDTSDEYKAKLRRAIELYKAGKYNG